MPVTVQQTSKRWKVHLALSSIVFVIGMLFVFDADHASWAVWAVLGGAVWHLSARLGAWWSTG